MSADSIPMELVGVRIELPTNQPIVLLREIGGTRFLPIWIGAGEATAIAFALEGVEPQRIALLTMPGEWEFFEQFAPETFVNEVCARIVIRGDKYRPVKYARNVRCPVLMQVCEKDEVIPVASARETEKLLGKHADARYYPIGHFDIYKGDHFERAVEEQVGFLQKHLGTL